jgi:hypothetical protein
MYVFTLMLYVWLVASAWSLADVSYQLVRPIFLCIVPDSELFIYFDKCLIHFDTELRRILQTIGIAMAPTIKIGSFSGPQFKLL